MRKENPYRNKAERLRKSISEPDQEAVKQEEESTQESRMARHRQTKRKKKVQYPIIRLLAMAFVILPILLVVYYQYSDSFGGKGNTSQANNYEEFGVDTNNPKGTIIETVDQDERKGKQPDEGADAQPEAEKEPESTPEPEPPVVEEKEKEVEAPPVVENTPSSEKTHQVQPGETIFRIAMNYYQSPDGIEIIKAANGLSSNDIMVGQVLKIPSN